VEVRIEEAGRIIKRLYELGDRTTTLLLGGTGIGKSEIVKQVARELASEIGKEFVDYHDDIANEILGEPDKYFVFVDLRLTEVEPSDLIGVPRDDDGSVRFKPLLWGKVLSKCAGILFLDEITNVQRLDVQSAMYKLLLDRKVGFIKMHEDVFVIAAGNRPEDSSLAVELPTPAIGRVRILRCKVPSLEMWSEYMDETYGDKWDRRVIAFLAKNRELFYSPPEEGETLEAFAVPRTWTALAKVSHELSGSELEAVAYGTVGGRAASHFLAFVNMNLPDVNVLLSNPAIWERFDTNAKYFMSLQVTSKLAEDIDNGEGLKNVRKFFDYLLSNDREFLVLINMFMKKAYKVKLVRLYKQEGQEYKEFLKSLYKRCLA